MKQLKKLALVYLTLLLLFSGTAAAMAKSSTPNKAGANTALTGWVKKGKSYYYRKKGQLVKNKLIKIGKYRYGFDQKGHSIRSKSAVFGKQVYTFDSKGRMILSHKQKSAGNAQAQSCFSKVTGILAYNITHLKLLGKSKKGTVWLGRDTENAKVIGQIPLKTKLYDQKGNVIRASSLKKGMTVRIYHSMTVFEPNPVTYEIYRAVVLSDAQQITLQELPVPYKDFPVSPKLKKGSEVPAADEPVATDYGQAIPE